VEKNISLLAGFFSAHAADLRPHFKTPKCEEVARLQLEAGAIGLTCAKLGEAEALVQVGIRAPILIANQLVGEVKLQRLAELATHVSDLCVAVDNPLQIEALETVLAGSRTRLGALVEVDIGMHRCGTDSPAQTVALAQALRRGRVHYRGIMGYEGHAVLVPDVAKRKSLAAEALTRLEQHRRALIDANLDPEIVSAGGTGTYDITGTDPSVTEVQAGSYVFMDGAYRKVRSEFECALTLLTTVIHRRGSMLITDAGMKSLSHEFGMPQGANLPLRCVALSEEHAHVLIDEDADLDVAPGDRIELLPSHGDTTINLHDRYAVIRGEQVEAHWAIIGRGRFR
jgi:D-serine deaminase-like pyridoxal phosphate-dependent protein